MCSFPDDNDSQYDPNAESGSELSINKEIKPLIVIIVVLQTQCNQTNHGSGVVIYLLQKIDIRYVKSLHHTPNSIVWHCVESISEIDVDSVDSFVLPVCFMCDEMQFLHIDVYTSTLPASAFNWVAQVPTGSPAPQFFSTARWWCSWAVGIHCCATPLVFGRNFCWYCLLCGAGRWCHSLSLISSQFQCALLFPVVLVFYSPTPAQSQTPPPSWSSRVRWDLCLDLMPFLVSENASHTSWLLRWWVPCVMYLSCLVRFWNSQFLDLS